MLHEPIETITDPDLLEFLGEISEACQFSHYGNEQLTVFNFIDTCTRDPFTRKRKPIDAANRPRGTILKTRVDILPQPAVRQLLASLCKHFGASEDFIANRQVYIALNQLLNSKSKLRKPPPIRLF